MCRSCYKGISRALQGCFKGVGRVFPEFFKTFKLNFETEKKMVYEMSRLKQINQMLMNGEFLEIP